MKNCIVKIINNVFEKNDEGGLFPLTRAPLALQILHHLLGRGGGVFEHPPSISAPIGRGEKRKKY